MQELKVNSKTGGKEDQMNLTLKVTHESDSMTGAGDGNDTLITDQKGNKNNHKPPRGHTGTYIPF